MTHSMGGTPSLLIWHSRDLVNWKPIGYAATKNYGNSWAPDLTYYKGTFYLYTTFVSDWKDGKRTFENYVLIAKRPEGPWSEPIALKLPGKIDPGHIATPDGKRYLYVNKGQVVELDSSGTKTVGSIRQVYEGWTYPDEWLVECFCLESPKLLYRNGFYYLTSAQGGTTGPSTSHMAVVARSRSPLGPWENSPLNPLIKTRTRSERWWSQGHATLIDGPDGQWYAIYHGYENGYRNAGRQTLMLPVSWTADGWPVVTADNAAGGHYPAPVGGQNAGNGMALSDDFNAPTLGLQWRSWSPGEVSDWFRPGEKQLHTKAQGTSVATSSRLGCFPVNHAYEAEVLVDLDEGTEAGLLLYGTEGGSTGGIGLKNGQLIVHSNSNASGQFPFAGRRIWFKLRNLNNDVALYHSADGSNWKKMSMSLEVSGFRPISLTLYAAGEGAVRFSRFRYRGLD
jgi:xylan 1,4-beta-xylosidase